MNNEKYRVIFITGAGSGFGLDSAKRLLDLGGYKVIMADIQFTQEATELIKNIQNKDNLLVLSDFDVTDEEKIQLGVNKTIDIFGSIDVLLNSAGVVTLGFLINNDGSVISNEEIWRMLKINFFGTINVSKYVAKQMIQQNNKNDKLIVNISSVAGIESSRGMLAYGLSKGAVIGATLPMARDLGRYKKNLLQQQRYGIRVVTFAPQLFLTPMGKLNSQNGQKVMAKAAALGRLGNTHEFTDAFISVLNSTFLTGCVIRLDGGLRVPHL